MPEERPQSHSCPFCRQVMAVVLCAAVAAACSDSDTSPMDPEPDPEPADPVVLVEGVVLGTEVFPAGNTAEGGQGEPVGVIDCIEDVNYHYHAHLSLFVEGERIAVPGAIGITDAVFNDGFVVNGDCYYWTHTHDATGLIHIEPPVDDEYTVGQFFDVWGRPLTGSRVADYEGELSIFVDGERYEGDPRGIVLASQKHVSLQVGRPLAPPPIYIFQD